MKSVIAVLDKGFVYYGDVAIEDGWVTLTNVHNIRRFGTERGLGQLSITGPTKDTMLDPCATIKCKEHVLQHIIECHPEAWAKVRP